MANQNDYDNYPNEPGRESPFVFNGSRGEPRYTERQQSAPPRPAYPEPRHYSAGQSGQAPDRTVDASKGFLPDTTWYFKDQFHDATAYNDTALEIAKRVLSDDDFKDIFSDAALPQFGVAQDNRR